MRKLKLQVPDTMESPVKRKVVITSKPKSILEAFENIVELAENSNLDEDFFESAGENIRYASRKLKLNQMQTALLAIFVDRSEDNSIRLSELAKYAGCRTTRMLRLSTEIDRLVELRYIRASSCRNVVSYRVPLEALNALRANQPYVHQAEPVDDTNAFFDRFDQLMKEKQSNELTHDTLIASTNDLLDEITSTIFATELRRHKLCDEDTLLFVFMAHLYVRDRDDMITFNDIEDIFDDDRIPSWLKGELRSRSSDLFTEELIENVNEDGMARSDAFKLTEKTKMDLLCELNIDAAAKSEKGLIKADSLAEKHLIYNEAEAELVNELSSILSADRFTDVQSRLRSAGMRPGFCCIFYGAPGTGKTETVYQIARRTGRSILRVDVDKIKSCWVGESEKNIKKLFDRYRNLCNSSPLAPILLFNEADAVLGVRMEGASGAVDKMENSIQNIILQEMETLEGIMIATTNLTTNLDKAFERRFLYKIRFDRPSAESRAQIWKSMLGDLTESDAQELAKSFDLSGGEIENIVRRHTVNAILNNISTIDLQALMDSCRNERLASSHSRVGF
ncbi:MAG: ATP-binding protein [Bacteroides sp.]|nr:ATP-binding protein [Bacteroides sp.]